MSTGSSLESGASGFSLSLMTEHDLLEVVEIEETCGLSRWGWEAYYTELLEGRGKLMRVARLRQPAQGRTERVAAFIAARLNTDELHVNNIAVREPYRRYGVAGALLKATLEEGARLGARRALLEVRVSNNAAQKLYKKYGFRVIARRPNYYTQPLEDALVMSLDLDSLQRA